MPNVEFTREGGAAYVTIRRAEALNAVDLETKAAITERLCEYRDDDAVRAVVFRSEGDRAFCAGGDLAEVEEHGFALEPFTESWEELFTTMLTLGKPTVAGVRGYALGGGFDLVLHTDIVIASEDAAFGQPEIDLGILNHFSPALLPRVVGLRKTLELLLTGETIPAPEAERIGLVNRAVPAEDLDDEVAAIVATLTEKPPAVLERLKEAVYTSIEMSPTAARAHVEARALEAAREGPWMREGVEAYLEGRAPDWQETAQE